MVVPIMCLGGTKNRPAQAAVEAGYKYGARLPGGVNEDLLPLYFADQDWRKPNRERYMRLLETYRPHMATVLDLERPEQLSDVLDWAEEAAQYVDTVVIIPKYSGAIRALPKSINGSYVTLGYAVGSKSFVSRSPVPASEHAGWPLHLLGGAPQVQLSVYRELRTIADVRSADSNTTLRAAQGFGNVWFPERPHWRALHKLIGYQWGKDAHLEAFRRSCIHVIQAWEATCRTGYGPMSWAQVALPECS